MNAVEGTVAGDASSWRKHSRSEIKEAGYGSGEIIKVHTRNVDYKGYTHPASEIDPQYKIKSSKTDHIAMHKGSALKKQPR